MTRLPGCKPADVERVLLRSAFYLDHSRGSHRYYRHADRSGLVVVPFHARDLKRGTLHAILKQAGLSIDEFVRLL